jgi:hypothetical protein
MRNLKSLVVAAFSALSLMFLVPATPANAQEPAYLHAISDLRTARAYLQMDNRPAFRATRDQAIDEIDHAILDMKIAAVDDGKNLWQTPPPQSGGDPLGPIHSAMRLLIEAHADVARGRDNPMNGDLQIRSMRRIDHAELILKPWM